VIILSPSLSLSPLSLRGCGPSPKKKKNTHTTYDSYNHPFSFYAFVLFRAHNERVVGFVFAPPRDNALPPRTNDRRLSLPTLRYH
jgi:hypothetical protein